MSASSVAPPNPAWRVTLRVRPRQEMGEQKHSAGRVFTHLCSLPGTKDLQYPTADHSLLAGLVTAPNLHPSGLKR